MIVTPVRDALLVSFKTTIEQTFMPARPQALRKRRKQGRPQKDMPAIGRATLISATRQLMKPSGALYCAGELGTLTQ